MTHPSPGSDTVDLQGKRLRLLWADLHGIDRGKYLYGDKAAGGTTNFCLGTYPLTFDREILPIEGLAFDVGLPDLQGVLDEQTLRPGWEPETWVGVADTRREGSPLPIDPRHALRRACQAWERDHGLRVQLAFEFEIYLLRPDGEGGWRPLATPGSRVYGTGRAVDPDGVMDEIVFTAADCGFPLEAWCTEFDDSQFEINLRYGPALDAADDAFLLRLLAREVAARRGHLATFIGRPLADRGGSGLHVNISFLDADGRNALADESSADGLSELARRAMAGMLAHHEGTAAMCAPTVNAYKRLLPDMMNGYWANWGHDDRTVAVRISPDRGPTTRLENRVPDGAANPYLAAAALLHACRAGVTEEMDLPPAQPVGSQATAAMSVPRSLADALDAFGRDTVLCEALGPELVDAFTRLKRAEWERYVAAVEDPATSEITRWELEYYTPFY
jgi:glutamine synthetase